MHLIFGSIPTLFSSDFILYFLPVLSILILFFSFKTMFYKAPKLRRLNKNYLDKRLFFPATERNKEPLIEVLSRILSRRGLILEIGSGSGEHGVVFQRCFPEITWQTSDPEPIHRNSISSWIDHEELNFIMPQPLDINVEKTPWDIPSNLISSLQGIISINMIHITSWSAQSHFLRSQ